jgi:nucleoside-diphosphate-sugar epimerase
MRVFVAGAAGAIGRQLIPILVGAGHDVVGTTRSPDRAKWLASAGGRPVIVDAYDRDALHAALAEARPDVVVHQLTDLAGGFDAANLASSGRLREVGTRNLVDASVAAGAGRLVAQSGAWLYADGPLPHDESHPLRKPTDDPSDVSLRGILELERVVMGTPGIDGSRSTNSPETIRSRWPSSLPRCRGRPASPSRTGTCRRSSIEQC